MGTKNALVLAGGGARGSYQIGVWQALRELHYPIHIITGTSVGALNGAVIVQGTYDDAVKMWERLDTGMIMKLGEAEIEQIKSGVFGTIGVFAKELIVRGGADCSNLEAIVKDFVDEKKVRSSPIEFGIVTVAVGKKTEAHEIYKEEMDEGQLCDYLLASAACFPAFQAHEINNVSYVDGGFADNLPVEMAVRKGADEIIAVDLQAIGVVKHRAELEKDENIRIIKSEWDLGNFLLFDQNTAKRNIRLGYLDTMKSFQVYEGKAYAFPLHTMEEAVSGEETAIAKVLQSIGLLVEPTSKLAAIKKAIAAKYTEGYGSPDSPRDMMLLCAETAGRVFELSPEPLYTLQAFDEAVREAGIRYTQEVKDDLDDGAITPQNLPALFKHLNAKSAVILLADYMQKNIREGNEMDYSPVATLFPREFAAASYFTMMNRRELFPAE